MKRIAQILLFITCTFITHHVSAEAYSCHGRVPNPVTDVSWMNIFPITLGGIPIAGRGGLDVGDYPPLVCLCPAPPPRFYRIGLGITFWEPARASEAVTTPMCAPLLGGSNLGSTSGQVKRGSSRNGAKDGNGFYYVHWYNFPLTNWMAFLTKTTCENGDGFDLMMLSEFEPTWQDDETATIFHPESVLFANLPGQAACAADCIAASVGFPLSELFWCAGCQGSMFPMTGNVKNLESGIQGSLLASMRMHAKLHRTGVSYDVNSIGSMCIATPQPLMNKRSYKTQMMYPIPQTFSAEPYGRTDSLWAAGREFPSRGEDFSYLIWRRRVCCASN